MLHCDDPRQLSLRALQDAAGVEEIVLQPAEAGQLTDCNTEAIWNEVAG
jgi:molybdopterin-guanine dinucleotide biosynthesis protein A